MGETNFKWNPFEGVVSIVNGRDADIILIGLKTIGILGIAFWIDVLTTIDGILKILFSVLSLLFIVFLLGESPYQDFMKLVSQKQQKTVSEDEFERRIKSISPEKINFKINDNITNVLQKSP